MNEIEVRRFAEKALFKITTEHHGVSCVDGRYKPHHTKATSLAGAGAGLLGTSLAVANEIQKRYGAILANEQVRDAVFELLGGKHRFSYHSDTDHGLNGCGHNARCISRSEEYGLTAEQSQFLKETLENLQNENIHPVELAGAHEEEAVIIVSMPKYDPTNPQSSTYSMHHQVEIDGKNTQAFIYTDTLVADVLKKLAKQLSGALPNDTNITIEDIYKLLQEKEAHQRSITVKELALDKGKPVYQVKINSDGKVIELNKIV